MADFLDGLNKQQREAVTAGPGPVIVYAGPGSGKTRVLTHRIAWLVQQGVYPGGIMAVTFTNKAASEMRTRAESLLSNRLQGIQIGTFHAICARILRREHEYIGYRSDYIIYDTDDQVSAITQTMNEMNMDTKRFNPRRVLAAISNAKNELVTPAKFRSSDYFSEIVARVYPAYQELLQANNAMDFDDLLMQTVLLLEQNDDVGEKYGRFYEHILVDEFQDTNIAQYKLVGLFGQPQNNIFVVGDEDQGIYAFRGADYRNVMNFRRDYPQAQMILLEQNYRSTQIVLDAARAVIDKNAHRQKKALFTDRGDGTRINVYEAYDEREEGEYVAQKVEQLRYEERRSYRDFAVMYRTNAQSRALEEAFISQNIPYKLVGGVSFYKRREIRDLLAYLRLVNNPDDSVSFNRIINAPKRGLGKKSLATFHDWAVQERMGYGAALKALQAGRPNPLSGRALTAFMAFASMMSDWQALAEQGDLVGLFDSIMLRTRYRLYLHEISDRPEQITEREENLQELRGRLDEAVLQEQTLSDFLTETALVADVDSLDADSDAVTLLTLHAAKGLEYPVVFITGLEDGLLPHLRSLDDPEGMAEERRLLYVGLTRAEDALFLTYAFRRYMFGSSEANLRSRFMTDIPVDLLQGNISSSSNHQREMASYEWETTWDRDVPRRTTAQPGSRARIIQFPQSEKPKPQVQLQYKTGMKVRHKIFGEGRVLESLVAGGDEEVTVSFTLHGVKKLAASIANLTILD